MASSWSQVLQTCSVQHLPMPYPFPSLLSSDPTFLLPPPHLSHHPPHIPQPGQFGSYPTQQARSVSGTRVLQKGGAGRVECVQSSIKSHLKLINDISLSLAFFTLAVREDRE